MGTLLIIIEWIKFFLHTLDIMGLVLSYIMKKACIFMVNLL